MFLPPLVIQRKQQFPPVFQKTAKKNLGILGKKIWRAFLGEKKTDAFCYCYVKEEKKRLRMSQAIALPYKYCINKEISDSLRCSLFPISLGILSLLVSLTHSLLQLQKLLRCLETIFSFHVTEYKKSQEKFICITLQFMYTSKKNCIHICQQKREQRFIHTPWHCSFFSLLSLFSFRWTQVILSCHDAAASITCRDQLDTQKYNMMRVLYNKKSQQSIKPAKWCIRVNKNCLDIVILL